MASSTRLKSPLLLMPSSGYHVVAIHDGRDGRGLQDRQRRGAQIPGDQPLEKERVAADAWLGTYPRRVDAGHVLGAEAALDVGRFRAVEGIDVLADAARVDLERN